MFQQNGGDYSLVEAHKLLLANALKDKDNYKFINISNSCIPLKSFNHIYSQLINNNDSYFNEAKHNIFPNCNLLLEILPKNKIKKASQWCILNKEHAQYISNYNQNTEYYKKIISF